MSAHLIAMCRVAEACPASVADHALRADSTHEPDRYVPAPARHGGIIDFITSAQNLLWIVAGLTAVALLVWQFWPGREDERLEEPVEEGRKEA